MSNKLESYIQSNLEELDRKKPDPAIIGRILAEMKSVESGMKRNGIVRPLTLLKCVAACLFLAVCFLGLKYFGSQEPTKELSKVNILYGKEPSRRLATNSTVHATVETADKRKNIIIKTFEDKTEAKQIVSFFGLNDMESAATRISAVASVSKRQGDNNAIIDTLIRILNNDPNANVRLEAMDGLTQYYREGYVRKELTASLKKQYDPVVQVNLIGLLVRIRELGVLPDLEKMINDEKADKSVRDFAYSGILRLRPELVN